MSKKKKKGNHRGGDRPLSDNPALNSLKSALSAQQRSVPSKNVAKTPPAGDGRHELERRMLAKAASASSPAARSHQHAGAAKAVKVKKGGKGKPAPTKLKFNSPADRAEYRELVKQQQAEWDRSAEAQRAVPATSRDPDAERRTVFERIRELIGKAPPHVEDRPDEVSKEARRSIRKSIETGAQAYGRASFRDLDNGFIVGFDFGTSSLKLAVRQPYRAGPSLAIMPALDKLRSGGHSYLWQTVLWFNPATETFSLCPDTGCIVLEGFKVGILAGRSGDRVRAELPVTKIEAATAFVTLQLANFFGWYHAKRPLGEAAGDRHLAINMGIPVASQDDEKTYRVFRHILAAAHALLPVAGELSLLRLRQKLAQSGGVLPDGWHLVPELTAAIAGYAALKTAQDGAHILVDVGASTLDIVAFNHIPGEKIAVISASVELLGAACLETAQAAGIDDKAFKAACNHQFDQVFGEAKRYERGGLGFNPLHRKRDVQLVTTGGGCAAPLHAEFLSAMTTPDELGASPAVRPTPPDFAMKGTNDGSRLLLAYGLTRDIPELLDLSLPSQVPTITPRPPTPDVFISKDMM